MKKVSYMLCMLLVLSGPVFAEGPDISGDWALEQVNGIDHGKYFADQSPEADSGILITHTQDSLLISSNCAACGNLVKEYILDGRKREMPNDKGFMISYRAKWDGDMIAINQSFGGRSPFGSVVVITKILYSISPDKSTLTVYSSNKDPDGDLTVPQRYRKAP